MFDKQRGRAYRQILAGLRYHCNEKLSFLTIGYRRGYEPDTRRIQKELSTKILREKGFRYDYFLVTVKENTQGTLKFKKLREVSCSPSNSYQQTTANSILPTTQEGQEPTKDERWRTHQHMIWNAPYIQQSNLVKWLQQYTHDNVTVHITHLDGDDKRTVRYMMQYLGNQGGLVTYSKSIGWLPAGHRRVWEGIVHHSRYDNNIGSLEPYTLVDALNPVDVFNDWIDKQRLERG